MEHGSVVKINCLAMREWNLDEITQMAALAKYYEIKDFKGKVGFISPMSHGFCEDCNRIRLTADGQLKLCLEYNSKLNVRDVIRRETEESALTEIISSAIFLKPKHNTFCKRK